VSRGTAYPLITGYDDRHLRIRMDEIAAGARKLRFNCRSPPRRWVRSIQCARSYPLPRAWFRPRPDVTSACIFGQTRGRLAQLTKCDRHAAAAWHLRPRARPRLTLRRRWSPNRTKAMTSPPYAPRMARLPAPDPGFEFRRDGKIESLDAFLGFRRKLSRKDRRQRCRHFGYNALSHL
jgi:hypothetical protein